MAPSNTSYLKVSKKFDIPIYSGAWIPSPISIQLDEEVKGSPDDVKTLKAVFAGGGGDPKHGIKNRIVIAEFDFESHELSEELYHISTGDEPAFNLAVHPGGESLVASFESGSRLYDLKLDDKEKVVPSDRKLNALEGSGEQKFVVFSPDGTRMAAGGEDKRLLVLEWPSLDVLLDVKKAHELPLKDGDFSVDGKFLATTADSGPCHVWDVASDKAVATLSVNQAKIGLCRFSTDDHPFLFTTAIKGGKGFIVVWNTEDWTQIGVKKFHDDPISAFSVSKNGLLLGFGTAVGDVSVVEVKKMRVVQTVKEAHMVFTTAVDFSPNGKALLSVSGDSSARVTEIEKLSGTDWKEWQVWLLLATLFLITAFIAYIFNQYYSEKFWNFPLGKDQPARAPSHWNI